MNDMSFGTASATQPFVDRSYITRILQQLFQQAPMYSQYSQQRPMYGQQNPYARVSDVNTKSWNRPGANPGQQRWQPQQRPMFGQYLQYSQQPSSYGSWRSPINNYGPQTVSAPATDTVKPSFGSPWGYQGAAPPMSPYTYVPELEPEPEPVSVTTPVAVASVPRNPSPYYINDPYLNSMGVRGRWG